MNASPKTSAFDARSLPPEWRLILACARVHLDTKSEREAEQLLAGTLDWRPIVANAARHHVDSLLYRHLTAEFTAAASESVLESLKELCRKHSRGNLYLTAEMVEVLDRFEAAGLTVIPYKGPALAAMAYGDLSLRYSSDLDFALPHRDLPRAFEVLLQAGFRSELDPARERDARLIANGQIGQYCFYSTPDNTLIELHTEKTLRYFPVPLEWEMLGQRLQPVAIGGRKFRTFSKEDTFLLLCVHGAKHFWSRLNWLCDLAEIMRNSEVNWELSEESARRVGCHRMWLLGLFLANGVLDAPLPASAARGIERDAQIAALGREVLALLFRSEDVSPSAWQKFFFRFKSYEKRGLRQCLRFATRPTQEDRHAYALPAWANALYPVIRPWRLVRDHGVRARRS